MLTGNIVITGVNDPPILADLASFAGEETSTISVAPSIIQSAVTDPDANDTHQAIAIQPISAIGIAEIGTNGDIFYQRPDAALGLIPGETLVETFEVVIEDAGGLRASANYTVTISGRWSLPTATGFSTSLGEKNGLTNLSALVQGSVLDPDVNDSHTTVSVDTTGTLGSVTIDNGQLFYDPAGAFDYLNTGQTANDSFEYTIADQGGLQATATATVLIIGASNTLNVSVSGLGTGQIGSLPNGIVCGAGVDGCQAEFDVGSTVTLTPSAPTGSRFGGWVTGPCAGETGPCDVAMLEAQAVEGRFEIDQVPTGRIVAATLPGARSSYVGGPDMTVFMTVISRASTPAQSCRITMPDNAPFTLSYSFVDAGNNAIGGANPRFDLANGAAQAFVLGFTPTAATPAGGFTYFPRIQCENVELDPIEGVNSVQLSIGDQPVPDILSIAATPTGDGVIRIASSGGVGFMSAAAVNIGAGDGLSGPRAATITASVDTGAATLPLTVEVCETNSSGVCLAPRAPSVRTIIDNDASLFAVFARSSPEAGIPFDPASARVFLRFTDDFGILRSVTSAAVTSPEPAGASPAASIAGQWSVLVRQPDGIWPSLERATLVVNEEGNAIIDVGGEPRALTLSLSTIAPSGEFAYFELAASGGYATRDGQIVLGNAADENPGHFWGVRETIDPGLPAGARFRGEGNTLDVGSNGQISGYAGGCFVSGQVGSPGALFPVGLSGCAASGPAHGAIIDDALVIASHRHGWRLEGALPQ